MGLGSGGARDVNILFPVTVSVSGGAFVGSGFSATTGRTEVSPLLVGGENTAIILTIGQSTSANICNSAYTPSNAKVHNLNIHNGAMYRAVDPLLGPDGLNGNWASELGDKLITAGTYDRVILVPIALSGANANEWGSGACNHRIVCAIKRLSAFGMTPTFVLYQQGESEQIDGISKVTYKTGVTATIATLRGLGVSAPIFIAKATMVAGVVSATIQAGQAELVDNPNGVYAGADADSLDGTNRFDGTHWNATGRAALATLWQSVLTPFA